MALGLIVLAALSPSLELAHTVSGSSEWEEEPIIQQIKSYHPYLQFGPGNSFIFATCYYTARGKYQIQGDHYEFRPELAAELNHSDVDKLTADLNPEARNEQQDHYAQSLSVFSADYSAGSNTLTLSCSVYGHPATFNLHTYTDGDESLPSVVSEDARSLVGVWSAPDPYPSRLDSKTRYRIGEMDGLRAFSREAIASDGAAFGLLDLRQDGKYRMHDKVLPWSKSGNNVILKMKEGQTVLTISNDGRKLTAGGRTVFER